VAYYGALSCQTAKQFEGDKTFKISIFPVIIYTKCYRLISLSFYASLGFKPYSFLPGFPSVTRRNNNQIAPINGINEINII
jgi:hypothetical protein